MSYFVNPSAFSSVFTVPCDAADKYLKIATPNQIKVLLFVMRNLSAGISAEACAEFLGISAEDAADCLTFWAQCGILGQNSPAEEKAVPERNTSVKNEMPTRQDVIRRGMEDERLMLLLREAQLKFGRNLKSNESAILVSLYDDNGMDVSVILMLLQYAASRNKCNVSFIRSTAAAWIKAGVETVSQAEEVISESMRRDLAWDIVSRVFGIRRKPSSKEAELADLWINKWKLDEKELKAAYDICVDTTSEFSVPYIAAVLEERHKKADGKSNEEPKRAKRAGQKSTSYDIELFEKMLNGD